MKAELLHNIQIAGLANVYEKRPEWKAAFEYYWQQTGDYNLKMGCTHCYVKILEWLKK